MQSKCISHLVFGALLVTTSQVAAAARLPMSVSTQKDMECLVAVISAAGKMEKNKQGSSQIAMMYYFGRIDSDDPRIDLEAAIRWQMSKMTKTDINAAAVRCGNQLTDRGHVMAATGQHLESNPPSTP